jgi:DMSO reductase family type II enzyme heme b subunit
MKKSGSRSPSVALWLRNQFPNRDPEIRKVRLGERLAFRKEEVSAMARLKYLVLLSAIVMLFLSMSVSQSSGIEKPKPTKDLLKLGKEVFSERCAICHGEKGDGKGEVANLLYPAPRDFTLAVFKIRTTPTGSLPADEDLFRTVSEGMAGTVMFPFKNDLSERERWAVVYFIKTFSDRWKEEKPEKSVSIGAPPPKTDELLAVGEKVYKDLKCWECHGENGKGDGPKSDTLKDDAGIPIFPYDFTKPGKMKGGYRVEDVVRTFLTGVDGTPMPAYEVDISDKERWAAAYYTLALSEGKPAPKIIGNKIIAQRYKGLLPNDPMDEAWQKVKAVEMPVQLLWTWIKGKTIETIHVRSLYNESEIAVLVEWDDSSKNDYLEIDKFVDAVAIQLTPSEKKGRTFFGMGDKKQAVNIWYWMADSEVDSKDRFTFKTDFPNPLHVAAKHHISPVEDLNAANPGTLTLQSYDSQDVKGRGLWANGKWHVLFRRSLKTGGPNDMQLRIGGSYPIAFAVWEGSLGNVNGKKAITPWQMIELK